MREIVLDTETTGLDPATGDRIVEIGAIELLNGVPTGEIFHTYINPERDMPEGAFRVHGLSAEFLKPQPIFAAIIDAFSAFIASDRLVIHNAEFDIKFINHEFARLNRDPILFDRVLDTLTLARKKHPGVTNTLDALCQRYGIDASRRKKHGALLDSELLAEVYLELSGGRQSVFALQSVEKAKPQFFVRNFSERPVKIACWRTEEETKSHRIFSDELGEKAIWRKFSTFRSEDGG